MSRGYELCEDDAGHVWWWKRCEIGGCQNLVCTWKSDRFCWSHSGCGLVLAVLFVRGCVLEAQIVADFLSH